jgi:hypothetical protein
MLSTVEEYCNTFGEVRLSLSQLSSHSFHNLFWVGCFFILKVKREGAMEEIFIMLHSENIFLGNRMRSRQMQVTSPDSGSLCDQFGL